MKSLQECLNEAQINESKRIYVLVKGEKNYGIDELVAAYSSRSAAERALFFAERSMEEYEEDEGITSPDYLEVIEVNLH